MEENERKQIRESQNHFGWERPPRLLSPRRHEKKE